MPDGYTLQSPQAVSSAMTEKRPLFRPLPPAPAFPAHALGPLQKAAEAVQNLTQAPLAICAQSVLATATLVAQAHRDVELPGGGQKPLTGLFVSVADSGERKTSVDKIALASVYRIEAFWREEAEEQQQRYRNAHDAWKEARTAILKKFKSDRHAMQEALKNLGPEPKPPPHPMLLVSDPTPEALVQHLEQGRPFAGVFTAEGGILMGGAAFSDESRMRTGALLNTLWDGEPIRRRRVGTGASYLPGRRCSAHVMMQPVVSQQLFGDGMLDGIGLLARTLVVAPEGTAGTRMWCDPSPASQVTLKAYNQRIEELLRRPPALSSEGSDVLSPPVMQLTEEARQLWIEFYNTAERAIGPDGEWQPIRPFGAKAAEHAGRLAAVLAVYADPSSMIVSAEFMACGITLAQHYAVELLRLQGTGSVSPDLRSAQRLLEWLEARSDPRFHLAAIYQRGPNALGDAATARRIVGILESHGFVRRLPEGTEIEGTLRKEAWMLVP